MPILNRAIDDRRLDYLRPFLEARFGVLTRTTGGFVHWDFENDAYVIEAKFRGARVSAYDSYRLSRRKFDALRRAAAERDATPIFAWAFSDAVVYADPSRIAPAGYEIPWQQVGRVDRVGTPRRGAHDIEDCWDVPRALVHTLECARWDPVVDLAA